MSYLSVSNGYRYSMEVELKEKLLVVDSFEPELALNASVPIQSSALDLIKSSLSDLEREDFFLNGHSASVVHFVVNQAGLEIASGSEDNSIKIWSLSHRQEIATLTGHNSPVCSLAYHPSGAFLASGSKNQGTIKFWNLQAKIQEFELEGHESAVLSLSFNILGEILASGSRDTSIKI